MKFLEALKHRFNLKLDNSEAVELQQIDDKLERLPYESPAMMLELHQLAWTERRIRTVEAYSLKKEAEEALTLAKNSGDNREAWDKAYRAAQASDVVVQRLLVDKLLNVLVPSGGLFTPGSHERKIFVVAFGLVAVNWFLKATTSIDKEVINEYSETATALLILPVLVLGPLVMRDDLDAYLHWVSFHRDSSDEVQRLALEVGVELGLAGKRLADSDSWVSQLVNRRDNGKALEAIKHSDVPLKLCCVVGKDILTDPVYSSQNPERFERKTILAWLKIRGTHPITQQVLYADDLKRDLELKHEADAYVDNELEVDRKYTRARKALMGLSSFSDVSDDEDDDELADLYQNKFC